VGGDPMNEAMAVSPDGRVLYVVDTARSVVAAMDTEELKVTAIAKVDFGSLGAGQARARINPGGNALFVAKGSSVVAVDTATLRATQAWALTGPVFGLGFSADGTRMYVAMPDEIALVDPSNGHQVRMIPVPGVASIEYVGSLAS
jgi:DNA-binding beta-propeller fold protein YncE